jgi:hypothetical protein
MYQKGFIIQLAIHISSFCIHGVNYPQVKNVRLAQECKSVVSATWDTEIGRIVIQEQPRRKVKGNTI